MHGRIKASYDKFEKYLKKAGDTTAYAAATILHPSRRVAHIERYWKEWRRPAAALEGVKKLWETYRDADVTDLPATAMYCSSDEVMPPNAGRELDDYDLMVRDMDLLSAGHEVGQDEYETYISQNLIHISGTALEWWLLDQQRKKWARLAQMAIDILSVPAMSDEPERVFSGARRTISWERSRLSSTTVERTECLKSWLRSGLVSKLTEDEVPLAVED